MPDFDVVPIPDESQLSSERMCRVCGCTDDSPCDVGGVACSWVLEDLCSRCASERISESGLYERFTQALLTEGERRVELNLSAAEACVLHGMIALAMDHPDLARVSDTTMKVGRRFREFCKYVFREMGMTTEDAELLDHLREADQWEGSEWEQHER